MAVSASSSASGRPRTSLTQSAPGQRVPEEGLDWAQEIWTKGRDIGHPVYLRGGMGTRLWYHLRMRVQALDVESENPLIADITGVMSAMSIAPSTAGGVRR
ncbi:hypothetical protein GCM10027569_92420 [Flindersiella endophytica]